MHRNRLKAVVILAVPAAPILLAGEAAGGGPGLAVAAVVTACLVCFVWAGSDKVVLRAMRARPVSEVEYPRLYRLVREVSKAARLPVPRIYVSPAMQPNSFAVGHGRRRAAVCCTEGLLRMLGERELRGVLGHELAHVRRRDTLVCSVSAGLAAAVTFAAGLATFLPFGTREVRDGRHAGDGGLPGMVLMAVFGPIAALVLQLSLRRVREYHADAMGALLVGDPLALASALRKIEAGTVQMPLFCTGPIASASHLMIVNPFRPDLFTLLFSTHPPTRDRVLRLEALAGYPR